MSLSPYLDALAIEVTERKQYIDREVGAYAARYSITAGATSTVAAITVLNSSGILEPAFHYGIEIDNVSGLNPVLFYSGTNSRWQVGTRTNGDTGQQGGTFSLGNIINTSTDGTTYIDGPLNVPTIYGGIADAGNLTLSSTTHANKGKIFFGANSAYDESISALGIGTASPTVGLEIVTSNIIIRGSYLTTFAIYDGSDGSFFIENKSTGFGTHTTKIWQYLNHDILFGTADTEVMRLKYIDQSVNFTSYLGLPYSNTISGITNAVVFNNGIVAAKLGLGTIPSEVAEIYYPSARINLRATTGDPILAIQGPSTTWWLKHNVVPHTLEFRYNDSLTALFLKYDGKVGIGPNVSGVQDNLHVTGTAAYPGSFLFGDYNNYTPVMRLYKWMGGGLNYHVWRHFVDGTGYYKLGYSATISGVGATGAENFTERMTITTAGYIGIGTNNPSCKLDIVGAVNVSGTSGILKIDPSNASYGSVVISAPAGTYIAAISDFATFLGKKIFVHDSASTKYLSLSHNGTNGIIDTNNGSMILSPNSGTVGIGTSTFTAGHSLTMKDGGTLGSTSFSSGFAGSGWRMESIVNNKSSLETDNLTLRGIMRVYELLINQIRATNGSLWVSSVGKPISVSGPSGGLYTLNFETASGLGHGFAAGDLIRAQRFNYAHGTIYQSNLVVSGISGQSSLTATLDSGNPPASGMEFVRIGNTGSTADRQGSIYLTADDSYAPFIDVYDEVSSFSSFNTFSTLKSRFGKLSGITSPLFGVLAGYGSYISNLYAAGNANIIGTLAVGGGSTIGNTFFVGRKYNQNLLASSNTLATFTLQKDPGPTIGSISTNTTILTPDGSTGCAAYYTASGLVAGDYFYSPLFYSAAINKWIVWSFWTKATVTTDIRPQIQSGLSWGSLASSTITLTAGDAWKRVTVIGQNTLGGPFRVKTMNGEAFTPSGYIYFWGGQVETYDTEPKIAGPYQKTDTIVGSLLGATEYCTDPNCETIGQWQNLGTWTASYQTAIRHAGSGSIMISGTSAGDWANTARVLYSTVPTSLRTYRISFWAYRPTGVTASLKIAVDGGTKVSPTFAFAYDNSWQYYCWETPIYSYPSSYIAFEPTTSGYLYIDDISMREVTTSGLYSAWTVLGGFGGTQQNPVVEIGDAGLRILPAVGHSTPLTASGIQIGNITGTASSAIKLTNTGTGSTSGLFGYTSAGTESFSLRLDGTANIAGWSFNNTTLSASTIELDSANKIFRMGSTLPGYTTGSGIWMGLNSGVYKLFVGTQSGNQLTWDGTTLSITGSITATTGSIGGWAIGTSTLTGGGVELNSSTPAIRMGDTLPNYDSGTGIWMGYKTAGPFGSYKLFIGNSSADKLLWDGTALALTGGVTTSSGVIGGWTLGTKTLTGTGVKLDSDGNILLGTDTTNYSTANIGLNGDGSGKLANNHIYWDTSGNVTFSGTITSLATITGGTFQTAVSGTGQRVVLDTVSGGQLRFYASDNSLNVMIGDGLYYGVGTGIALAGGAGLYVKEQASIYVNVTKIAGSVTIPSYGGYFSNQASVALGSAGVAGIVSFASVTADPGFGVFAAAFGDCTYPKYGIYAYATGSGVNWAGYFGDGNVHVDNKLGIGVSDFGSSTARLVFPTSSAVADAIEFGTDTNRVNLFRRDYLIDYESATRYMVTVSGMFSVGIGIRGTGQNMDSMPYPKKFLIVHDNSTDASYDILCAALRLNNTITTTHTLQGFESYIRTTAAVSHSSFGIAPLIANFDLSAAVTVARVNGVHSGGIMNAAGTVTEWRLFNGIMAGSVGTITTGYGLYIDTFPSIVATKWGAYIADATANSYFAGRVLHGTNTLGSAGAKLIFATDTTVSGGIEFGTGSDRANLYRSAADTLKTDDKFVIADANGSAAQLQIISTAYGTGLTVGGDTNLYRTGANSWQTDDSLTVGGNFTAQGTVYVGTDSGSLKTIQAVNGQNYGDLLVAAMKDENDSGGILYLRGGDGSTLFGDVVIGQTSGLPTATNGGFLYIPTMNGAPSGTPTDYTGTVAMVYDTSNNQLWVYNHASDEWRYVALAK